MPSAQFPTLPSKQEMRRSLENSWKLSLRRLRRLAHRRNDWSGLTSATSSASLQVHGSGTLAVGPGTASCYAAFHIGIIPGLLIQCWVLGAASAGKA